jgi:hypothetical protein
MLVYRSTVAAAVFAGALLIGCTAPDQPTDLRKDGPPNITTVTVMSDLRTPIDPHRPSLGGRLYESAAFCKPNDEKRPGLVGLPDFSTLQVCPDTLSASATSGTEGAPPVWFARVVFDELLDPTVEDLIPQLDAMMKPVLDSTGHPVMLGTLANTQPVTLTCNGVAVPYSGYYVPNGNSISWPLGPALFIQPLNPVGVPTDATCEVGIKDVVHNKDGESVPSDQRAFPFKIAPMKLRFSDPDPSDDDPGKIEVDPDSPVGFFWTAAFTTMPAAADIKIFSAPNLNVSATNANGDPDTSVCGTGGTAVLAADIVTAPRGATAATTALVMDLSINDPDHAWVPTTTYRVEFAATAKITPKQGGADGTFPTGYSLCFHTTAPAM